MQKVHELTDWGGQHIAVRLGAHRLVKTEDEDLQLVDANLSRINAATERFESFPEAQDAYTAHLDNMPENEPDGETLQRKDEADMLFLRAVAGEEIDFETYSTATVGVPPERAPEQKIEILKQELDTLLQERGLRYDAKSREAFDKLFLLQDPSDIKRQMETSIALAKRAVSEYMVLPNQEVEPEYLNVPKAPWAGWAGTDEEGNPFMRINISSNRKYTPGKIHELAFHEYGGHCVQFALWKEAIEQGRMNRALGVLAMTSPEVTQAEAVAQISGHLMAGALGDRWWEEFQPRYEDLKVMVKHNMHLMINNGLKEGAVIAYGRQHLPLEAKKSLQSDVVEGRDNPMARACLAAYWPGLKSVVEPLFKLDPSVRKEIIARLYTEPLTFEQSVSMVAEAGAASPALAEG